MYNTVGPKIPYTSVAFATVLCDQMTTWHTDGRVPLRLGLSWDFFPDTPKTDLDCAVLAFDSSTSLVDACFFNQLSILGGAVVHSGDQRDGSEEGFDEVITVDTARLPPDIQNLVFICNAHSGGTLADVETARATFQQGGKGDVCSMGITCGRSVSACGSVIALLSRHQEGWTLAECRMTTGGRTFKDSYGEVLAALQTVVDPVLLAERRANMRKTFNMQKNDVCELPSNLFVSGEDLFVGLGWDTKCDVDAGILIADKNVRSPECGARFLNIINFRDKEFGKAVLHHGDNLTGEGAGDDERIDIDLDYMPPEVGVLWIVVNIYNGGATFDKVKGAYIRLVAASNGHVLCRFNLTDATVRTRGLVLGKIYRNAASCWCFEAVASGCDGQTANDTATRVACGITGGSHPDAGRIEEKAFRMHTKCTKLTMRIKGVKLAAKDGLLMGGKSDPYFEIVDITASAQAASTAGSPIARSEVIKNSLNPVWMELSAEVDPGHHYRLDVYDWDCVGSNDLIGRLDLGLPVYMPTRLGGPGTRHKLVPPPPPHQQEAGEIEVVALTLVREVTVTERILQARKQRSSSAFARSSDQLLEI